MTKNHGFFCFSKEKTKENAIICKIIKGKSWTHVLVDMTNLPKQKGGYSKLTENDVRMIRTRKDNGEKQAVLVRDYKVSATAISEIVNRKKWSHVN